VSYRGSKAFAKPARGHPKLIRGYWETSWA